MFTEHMEQLGEHLVKALRLQDVSIHPDIQTDAGRLDLIIRSGDDAYLVEVKASTATIESLGRLHLLATHPEMLGSFRPPGRVTAVLAAPSFARSVEALAKRTGIETVAVPMTLLRDRATDLAPLTRPKAWNVVVEVLRQGHNPGVRRLAKASGTSVGWTSGIVRSLEARTILDQDGELDDNGILRLLDQVATERPLEKLCQGTVETGIHDWDDAMGHLYSQWFDIVEQLEPPGFYQCGQTAALAYSDHIQHHAAIQAYAYDADTLTAAMEGLHQGGGVQFKVYRPDRPMSIGTQGDGPKRRCSLPQTLLDVAGMGYAARDSALKLVEVLQNGHQGT